MRDLNLGRLYLGHRAGDMKELVALKYSKIGTGTLESPRTEVKVLAILNKDNHPHIVRMLDSSDDDKEVCLVMEWADGGGIQCVLRWQADGCIQTFLDSFRAPSASAMMTPSATSDRSCQPCCIFTLAALLTWTSSWRTSCTRCLLLR